MDQIPLRVIKRVLRNHFDGLSQIENAGAVGISQAQVSNIINILPESLKSLRVLSRLLRKFGMILPDTKEALEYYNKLQELGVIFEKLDLYIATMESLAENKDIHPKELVLSAMKITRLEVESGKTYSEALECYKKLLDKIKKLSIELKQIRTYVRLSKRRAKQALNDSNTTIEQIRKFEKIIHQIEELGASFDDLELLYLFIQNAKDSNWDPKKLFSLIKKLGRIVQKIKQKEELYKDLTKELNELIIEIEKKSEEINSFEDKSYAMQRRVEGELQRMKDKNQKLKADRRLTKSVIKSNKSQMEYDTSIIENNQRIIEQQRLEIAKLALIKKSFEVSEGHIML